MSGNPGTNPKSTIYIGGLADDVDESVLVEVFSTFGEQQIPGAHVRRL
jgi:RNA recognition motif-containing protein